MRVIAFLNLLLIVWIRYGKCFQNEPTCHQELINLKVQNERLLTLVTNVRTMARNCDQRLLAEVDEQLQEVRKHHGENSHLDTRESDHLRHRLEYNLEQQWLYMSKQFRGSMRAQPPNVRLNHLVDILRKEAFNRRLVLLVDTKNLGKADGAEVKRKVELDALEALVQNRFHQVQHPRDCSRVKRMICTLDMPLCGFGCLLHRMVQCMLVSYETKRPIMLESNGWGINKQGWNTMFLNLSGCIHKEDDIVTPWGPNIDYAEVISLPRAKLKDPRPKYMPLAVPEDISEQLSRLHGNPIAWWMGQMVKFMIRPNEETTELYKSATERLRYEHPIVGIHVRRTDKNSEARYHKLEEYMYQVEEYYHQLTVETSLDVKRVYLATDDVNIIQEAKRKYPGYVFVNDAGYAQSAKTNRTARASGDPDVVRGIVMDIYFLSNSDFLVCTMSSNVCRVSYELMQTLHTDASKMAKSIDRDYYVDWSSFRDQRALFDHDPRDNNEIMFVAGETIHYTGTQWDGNNRGISQLDKSGRYPTYKAEDIVQTYKFTSYDTEDSELRK